jgi:tetratricopeptide (TPR) repeat protein
VIKLGLSFLLICAKIIRVMSAQTRIYNCIVTAFLAIVINCLPLQAENAALGRMFALLQEAEPEEARKIADEIELQWSKSGSPAMDLLLKRGEDALEVGDSQVAIEHLTALTDHAPEFAQGWHMRAVAFAQAGLYGPAVADLEQVLALEPRHFNAIISLAAVLEQVNKPQLAYEAYQQVLAIHPHQEDVTTALERLSGTIGSDL